MAQSISNVAPKKSLFSITGTGNPSALFPAPSFKMANSTPSTLNPNIAAGLSIGPTGSVVTAPKPTTVAPQTSYGAAPATSSASYVPPAAGAPAAPVASPTTPTTPVKGVLSYPSIVGSLATASNPSAVQTGLIKDISKAGKDNAEIANNARQISEMYGNQIAEIGRLGAGAIAGHRSTGTSVVGEGNAAIASQSASARMSALAAAQEAALQGTGQQLTAQQQLANALSAGLTGATNIQGQTITGLTSAAGFAQPQTAAFGQTVFNPLTGQYEGGGGLPADVMEQYAQMAANGQYAAIPSFITSNPVLSAQLNVAAKSINPSFTPLTSTGAGAVLQGVPQLQSANTAAEGIRNTIDQYLAANPQLNTSDLAAGNVLKQWLEGKQLTDPKYQVLFNYLNEYTNTLAPILGVGGDPTNLKTQIAQSFINAAASGQSISQVLGAMSSLASNKIADIQAGALGGQTTVPAGAAPGQANNQGWGWNP